MEDTMSGEFTNVKFYGIRFAHPSQGPWRNECTIRWDRSGEPFTTDAQNVNIRANKDGSVTIRPYAERPTP
jgi:hypothetical protein